MLRGACLQKGTEAPGGQTQKRISLFLDSIALLKFHTTLNHKHHGDFQRACRRLHCLSPPDKEASSVSLFDFSVPFLIEVDILLLVLKPSPALSPCLSPHFLACQTLTFGGKTTDLI